MFDELWQALQYQKKYEEKLTKRYLNDDEGEGKGKKLRKGSSSNKRYFMMQNDTKVKLFAEKTYPSLYRK